MEEILTMKQKILLRVAEEYGFVTLSVAHRVYNTPSNASNAIRKLVDLKLVKPTKVHGKFELVGREK